MNGGNMGGGMIMDGGSYNMGSGSGMIMNGGMGGVIYGCGVGAGCNCQ